jgi:hypothetical protein
LSSARPRRWRREKKIFDDEYRLAINNKVPAVNDGKLAFSVGHPYAKEYYQIACFVEGYITLLICWGIHFSGNIKSNQDQDQDTRLQMPNKGHKCKEGKAGNKK